jgi:hypothetical protein
MSGARSATLYEPASQIGRGVSGCQPWALRLATQLAGLRQHRHGAECLPLRRFIHVGVAP